eukprot:TRINITY_DN6573_c0_g1_i1.p1 TRINITY_DN6573_c0_g1~~TRINITY_DN6573_c0_g1_i1.p1  ORF type:complete len:453 (-),score=126.10 TRINITY_DN6573_c0_g1_i1:61-1419(-)
MMKEDAILRNLFLSNNGTIGIPNDLSSFVEKNQLMIGGLVIMMMGTLFGYLSHGIRYLWTFIKQTLWHSVMAHIEIRSEDALYRSIVLYLHEKKLLEQTNNLTATTHVIGRNFTHTGQHAKSLLVFSPGTGTHSFVFENKRIWMEKKTNESSLNVSYSIHLRTWGNTNVLRKLLLLSKEYCDNREGGVDVFTPANAGAHANWMKGTNRPKRLLDSVVLDDGNTDIIEKDVSEFLSSEDWYKKRGLNYRRGYLFYGPPGNGKSSILLALASHFSLPIYCLSLSDPLLDDGKLGKLMNAVPSGSAVIVEDVDCIFLERTGVSKSSVTFSGLLNAIDGVAASEGRILFMTTNHRDHLDEALVRPGRVDCEIYFGKAMTKQIKQMFLNFYDEVVSKEELQQMSIEISEKIPPGAISMAKLQGHFLRNKFDPRKSVDTCQSLLDIKEEEMVIPKKSL